MEESPFRGNNRTERLYFRDIFFERNYDFIEAVIIELWKPPIIPFLPPKSAWVWWQVYIGAVDAKILLRKLYLIYIYYFFLIHICYNYTFRKLLQNDFKSAIHVFISSFVLEPSALNLMDWSFLVRYLPAIRRSFLPFFWEKRTPDRMLVCYDFF